MAPYNTFYSQLEEHLNVVGIDPAINKWDEPVALGVVDPHDSLSHPAGVSDVQTESASRIVPDQFTNFLVCLNNLDDEFIFEFYFSIYIVLLPVSIVLYPC